MELARLAYKEVQTNKKQAKCSIPWLLLPVTAKKKIKESGGSGVDAEPSWDFGQSELHPLAPKLPRKGKLCQSNRKHL